MNWKLRLLLAGILLQGCQKPVSETAEEPGLPPAPPIEEDVPPEQVDDELPTAPPPEEDAPLPHEPVPEPAPEPKDAPETDPWKAANQQREELRNRINQERQTIVSQMRSKQRDKQKHLQNARNLRNKATKLKRDKDSTYKQLEQEAKEFENLAKQVDREYKNIQQQLKKIAKEQADGHKRISDWARKEADKIRKEEEAKRKQVQSQPEEPLETGPLQKGEARKAQVRSINVREQVLNLFGGSSTEGFGTQVYELGEDAAVMVDGVPGQLEAIPSGSDVSFWVHPDDTSTITWIEATTE